VSPKHSKFSGLKVRNFHPAILSRALLLKLKPAVPLQDDSVSDTSIQEKMTSQPIFFLSTSLKKLQRTLKL
jgi:hypothetical protein